MSIHTTVVIPAAATHVSIETIYFIVINSTVYYANDLDDYPDTAAISKGQKLRTVYPFTTSHLAIPIPLYLALERDWISADQLPIGEPARALAKLLGF